MKRVLVGIVMGSSSDAPKMERVAEVLSELEIGYETNVLSAHRTPEKVAEYGRTAAERGLKVLIAGAGLAAALPGVLAAHTILPVIGVPLAAGPMNGLDALYAIVQMPGGVPVATVGIDNAQNAALLAAEILAVSDEDVRERLWKMRKRMAG